MMHVMASFFGYATTVIPRIYTYYVSSLLFAIFGLKMLHEGYHMSPNEGQEEFEEVGEELRKKEEQEKKGSLESGGSRAAEVTAMGLFSKIFVQSFTMTTLAEWGDRSQMATVILAAREDVYGVCVGGGWWLKYSKLQKGTRVQAGWSDPTLTQLITRSNG